MREEIYSKNIPNSPRVEPKHKITLWWLAAVQLINSITGQTKTLTFLHFKYDFFCFKQFLSCWLMLNGLVLMKYLMPLEHFDWQLSSARDKAKQFCEKNQILLKSTKWQRTAGLLLRVSVLFVSTLTILNTTTNEFFQACCYVKNFWLDNEFLPHLLGIDQYLRRHFNKHNIIIKNGNSNAVVHTCLEWGLLRMSSLQVDSRSSQLFSHSFCPRL